MILYQKFLYSTFLVVVFISYATTKNLMIDSHVENLDQIKNEISSLQEQNEFLEGQIA